MRTLHTNIIRWAEARNLINGSTVTRQLCKLAEEFGEVCAGVARADHDLIKDSVGDCMVVAFIMARQLQANDFSFEKSALQHEETSPLSVETAVLGAVETLGDVAVALRVKTPHAKYKDEIVVRIAQFLDNLYDIASTAGLSPVDCLSHAYDEIKDRKGVMLDGVFIKQDDIPAMLDNLRAQYVKVNTAISIIVNHYGSDISDLAEAEAETKPLDCEALDLADKIELLEAAL